MSTFEPIQFGDPGKLIYLVGCLYDRSPIILQKKINRYLQDNTHSVLVFIFQEVRSRAKAIVRVIGEHELNRPIEIENDSSFLQQAIDENGADIDESRLDPYLKIEIKEILLKKYFHLIENCYIVPVYHPISKKICIYVCFVNYARIEGQKVFIKRFVEGCFLHCLPILKNSFALEEEKNHRKMGEEMFKSIVGLITDSEDEFYTYKGIHREALRLFKAEHCRVHLTDENFAFKLIEFYKEHKSSWRECSNLDIFEIFLPKNCIIAKSVAETGNIVNCKDAYNEPHAHADLVKIQDGIRTIKNSLSFPIISDCRIRGVIELINKINSPYFSEQDEEYAHGFGAACGSIIKCVKTYRRYKEKYHVREVSDCILLRDAGFSEFKSVKFELPQNLPVINNFYNFLFNPYDMLEKDVLQYVILIFAKLNILSKLSIDENVFVRFICYVLKLTPQLPFHNTLLSFNSFHFIVMIVNHCNIRGKYKFTLTEILLLLIAALTQDMDWKGPTSHFQVVRGASLPALYTSPGMVEKRMIISQIIRSLSTKELNIFKHMNSEENKFCIEMLHDLILATDISYHIVKKPNIANMVHNGYEINNAKHRKLFQGLIMTASQFSIFTKSWETCLEASDRIVKEFFRQGDISSAKGAIIDFKELEAHPLGIAAMHLEFLEDYCIPAFDLLGELLPNLNECYGRMLEFSKRWKIMRDEQMEQRQKELHQEELDKFLEGSEESESDSSEEEP